MAPSALCCLLLVLQSAPQDPTPEGPPPAAKIAAPADPAKTDPAQADPAPSEPAAADPTEVATLKRLEQGKDLDVPACVALTRSNNPAVAARATWLLGRSHLDGVQAALRELATGAPAAETRAQAMAALLRAGHRGALDTALAGLDDSEVRVRTSAAQLLGRIADPRSATGLLAFLSRPRSPGAATEPNTPASDAVAALLALHDLGRPEHLLPAASAVSTSGQPSLGQALVYLFQDLSPKLPPSDEAKVLVATLDHSEVLLRKYALSRLAVLADPTTTAALERCLAGVGPGLRPLAETALQAARRHAANTDLAAAAGPWQQIQARWQALPQRSQMLAGSLAGLCTLAGLATWFAWRRKRAAAAAAATGDELSDLVQPSAEHLAELEAEAEAALAAAEALPEDEALPQDEALPEDAALPQDCEVPPIEGEDLAGEPPMATEDELGTEATAELATYTEDDAAENGTEAELEEPAMAWSNSPDAEDEQPEPPRR